MKFTITSDPVIQRQGYAQPGQYDSLFDQLTPENNCIILNDAKETNKMSQALEEWAKKRKIIGAKVKTTKAYPTDKKPRIWLMYPPVPEKPKTQIRGNFPK